MKQIRALAELTLLAELLAQLDLQTAPMRERLDRLDAAVVRAREDAVDVVVFERVDERGSLLAPFLVERPPPVVTAPLLAVAGSSVAYEQNGQSSPRRTSMSRWYVRRVRASSSETQATSSTSSFGSKRPEHSIAQ
jgi:hypothetical protein